MTREKLHERIDRMLEYIPPDDEKKCLIILDNAVFGLLRAFGSFPKPPTLTPARGRVGHLRVIKGGKTSLY